MYKLLTHSDYCDIFDPSWFEVDSNYQLITGNNRGRGSAWFFVKNSQSLILKHYKRGGAIAKLSYDKYIYFNAKNTRSFKEFVLNKYLHSLDLPVPKPVAAGFRRKGVFYKAYFVSEKIPNSKTLHQYVIDNNIDEQNEIWLKIKHTVNMFHDIKLNHVDLNIRNILIDAQRKIYLIDFDKCDLNANKTIKALNFDRLQRSINKDLQLDINFELLPHK